MDVEIMTEKGLVTLFRLNVLGFRFGMTYAGRTTYHDDTEEMIEAIGLIHCLTEDELKIIDDLYMS